MEATNNTPPATKRMIATAGSWCEVVRSEGTLLSVPRGRSADADVGRANDNDEVPNRAEAVEDNRYKGVDTTGLAG
jgi:hypothetical protein